MLALEDKLGDHLRQLESSELLSGRLKAGDGGEMLDSHQDSEYGYLMCLRKRMWRLLVERIYLGDGARA